MSISASYRETLRRRAVQRFVKENQRAPTDAELNQLIFTEETAYPTVDSVGISGFDIKRPRYKGVSSVAMENTNRTAMYDDVITMSKRLDNLLQILEDSHRGFYGTSKRVGKLLDQTESRLDNLLLLNGSTDVFVVGIEETFDTQTAVDQSGSATVESGYVTLGRTGYTPVDISKLKMNATIGGRANVVGITASSPIDSLKEDDGSMWEYVVYTKEQQGRVTLVLTFEFSEASYVGDLRLTGLPISVNKKMTASCFYSLDGSSYTALDPVEQVATSEMSFQVGLDGIKKVQITLSKEAADSSTPNKGRYMYIFSLDSLKIYSDVFKPSERSTLLCGPYSMLDDQGNPVYFTKATLSACTVEPNDTSVSFYLSQDGSNWVGVSHNNDGGNYVSFQDGTADQSIDFVDDTAVAGSVVETVVGMEDIDFQTEAVLNTFVMSGYVDLVPLRSFVIKRNVPTSASPSKLLGAVPGWVFDKITQQYSTTLYVESPDGRFLDLGDTSATINGTLVSGQVFLPQGYSVFATADSNWIELGTYSSSDALEKADPLYPYNHKYLVEGYSYAETFVGERIYQGTDAYFGQLMIYRSPEEFAYIDAEDPLYYRMFTIEDADGNWYIKIKVDKTDASWKNETFNSNWAVQSSTTNQLYVRALLGTSEAGQTPRIDSFKVRVI
jgi:hypothetical protein